MVFAMLLVAMTLSAMARFSSVDFTIIGRANIPNDMARRVWLLVAALTPHNFPRVLTVGVSFGGGDPGNGTATAIGIGLQNMPEGFAVAVSQMTLGYSRGFAVAAYLGSGRAGRWIARHWHRVAVRTAVARGTWA